MFAKIQDVREMGKLPGSDRLSDSLISPHLEAAGRELTRWIGAYDSGPVLDDVRAACLEAECCICMAYLLPGMNTFYTEGIAGLQKEIGESEFQFHSVNDLKNLAGMWMQRARKAVADYQQAGNGAIWYGAV